MTQADKLTSDKLTSRPLPSLAPESGQEIRRVVLEALEESGQLGSLPTDLGRVARAHGVEVVSDSARLRYRYIQSLSSEKQKVAKSAFDKLKGIADLDEGVIWVPDDRPPKTRAFAKAHELSHHLLDWHDLPSRVPYLDVSEDMRRDVQDAFEREANFAAAELLFQCGLLKEHSAERSLTLQCPVGLSDEFRASFQSTIIRYVETAGGPLALGVYYRDSKNCHGLGCFDFWKLFASPSLAGGTWKPSFPSRIDPAHPWTQSSVSDQVITGKTPISTGETPTPVSGPTSVSEPTPVSDEPGAPSFRWEAWSNDYSIFVLLRPDHVDTPSTTR